jgi:hypothetical protein
MKIKGGNHGDSGVRRPNMEVIAHLVENSATTVKHNLPGQKLTG